MYWWKSQKIKQYRELKLYLIVFLQSKLWVEDERVLDLLWKCTQRRTWGSSENQSGEKKLNKGAVSVQVPQKTASALSHGGLQKYELCSRATFLGWGARVGLCFHIPTAVSYWLRVNWSGFGIPDTLVALHSWAEWLQQPEDSPLRKSFSCWSGGSDGKEYACSVGDSGSIPGSGRSPGEGNGNGNPLQYSCLEDSLDRSTWWAIVYGVAKSQTWLSN